MSRVYPIKEIAMSLDDKSTAVLRPGFALFAEVNLRKVVLTV